MRREQVRELWQRHATLIVSVVLAVAIGVGGWRGYEYLESQKAAESGKAFEAAITLSEQNKPAEAEAAFAKITADGSRGYRALARLRAAAEAGKHDAPAAVKLYEAIAADANLGIAERDIARIRAAGLLLDTASYDDIRQRLQSLSVPGQTFRHTAREMLALSAWRANDTAAARQWLDLIAGDPETPSGLRSRADALQALLPSAAKS